MAKKKLAKLKAQISQLKTTADDLKKKGDDTKPTEDASYKQNNDAGNNFGGKRSMHNKS